MSEIMAWCKANGRKSWYGYYYAKQRRVCELMLESVIQNQIRHALSSAHSVVLRLNSGKFYQGKLFIQKSINKMF